MDPAARPPPGHCGIAAHQDRQPARSNGRERGRRDGHATMRTERLPAPCRCSVGHQRVDRRGHRRQPAPMHPRWLSRSPAAPERAVNETCTLAGVLHQARSAASRCRPSAPSDRSLWSSRLSACRTSRRPRPRGRSRSSSRSSARSIASVSTATTGPRDRLGHHSWNLPSLIRDDQRQAATRHGGSATTGRCGQ
jgi:hypothetical protein